MDQSHPLFAESTYQGTRRQLLAALMGAFALGSTRGFASAAPAGKAPRLLVRSSWQTVNIGDIGHTPGLLSLLEEYLPEAEITLWPASIKDGVEKILQRTFPKVRIVQTPEEVKGAFAECEFFLHGSGASLVAEKQLAQWHKETGKPYGIYGITLGTVSAQGKDLLSQAKFVFFRNSVSLQFAKDRGITCPTMAFGPDAAFGVKLRNDAAAEAFLHAHNLETGKFLCVIPRLRYTPYWLIRHKEMTEEDHHKHARNEEMKEHDHAPLRDAIIAVARQTDLKILVCPEDESQVAIGKAMLVDPLPADVKAKVVWRDHYRLTDEALSTYVRSAGLFGLEMHSPIMCIGNGVPALVGRFKEQTSKGLMWRDIGLGDWLFDMDEPGDVARLTPTVLKLAQDAAGSKAKADQALAVVHEKQKETMKVLRDSLG